MNTKSIAIIFAIIGIIVGALIGRLIFGLVGLFVPIGMTMIGGIIAGGIIIIGGIIGGVLGYGLYKKFIQKLEKKNEKLERNYSYIILAIICAVGAGAAFFGSETFFTMAVELRYGGYGYNTDSEVEKYMNIKNILKYLGFALVGGTAIFGFLGFKAGKR